MARPTTMVRPSPGDIALALGVAAIGQVDVLAPDLVSTNVVGPRWAVSGVYLLISLALALRRTLPVWTFAFVVTVIGIQALTLGASEGNGTLLPALLATYSLAAHAPRREALIGLAAVPVLMAVRELNNPQNTSAEEVVSALGWDLTVVAAWLLGAYLRTRHQLVHELQQRAASAERQREERAAAAVAEERSRIARELHDVVAHSITVIVVQAEAAEEMLDHDPTMSAASLREIQRTGRQSLTEMRRLLGALNAQDEPVVLQGTAGIPDLVAGVRATGLQVELDLQMSDRARDGTDRAVYRIVQEALTNVLKHADATKAWVRVEPAGDGLCVEVRDNGGGDSTGGGNGTGVGIGGSDRGHGLTGMHERVKVYGGRFQAGPQPAGGFAVRAWLPSSGDDA